jgi:uncharacterized protein YecE (DUF72 family)
MKADGMLRFYAERFPAVEINNTFYRLPSTSTLESWTTQVPADFTFVLKASQRITHIRRLKPEAAEPLGYLLDASEVLGPTRGPILFQLPPNMKKDADRLKQFLELIPGSVRAAFEFRHESWLDDETFDALRDAGAALCIADSTESTTPFVATAAWGYARLRREEYDDAALAEWSRRMKDTAWSDAFVFFKHEDAGTGPRLARRFDDIFKATR